ncbi:hypothetical protein QTP88_012394 [Uroleucon formosanum]
MSHFIWHNCSGEKLNLSTQSFLLNVGVFNTVQSFILLNDPTLIIRIHYRKNIVLCYGSRGSPVACTQLYVMCGPRNLTASWCHGGITDYMKCITSEQ